MDKVRCPYCGDEMTLTIKRDSGKLFRAWFQCGIQCQAHTPVCAGYSDQDEAEEAAYAAAMRRADPVARAMTLDEFTQDENAVYVEDCYGNVEITIMRYIVPMRKPMYLAGSTFERDTCAYEIETYGKKWRAWTAKPTDAQRAAAKWET